MSWLTGWKYRKGVMISRASDAVTDYQMKVLVGESTGASGYNVNCSGNIKSDFSDLRFTSGDGITVLNYWIETISGTTPNQLATVWIKFDSIGTTDTQFYMYCGNPSATLFSNGANTFIVFEDFEWGSVNDDLSISGGSVTWTKEQGIAKINNTKFYSGTRSAIFTEAATPPIYNCPITASNNVSIQFRLYKEAAVTNGPNIGQGNGSKVFNIASSPTQTLNYWDGTTKATGAFLTPDAWQLVEMNNFNWSGGTFDIWLNGIKVKSGATMASGQTMWGNVFRLSNQGTNVDNDIWFDNVIVRNYNATEPVSKGWQDVELSKSFYLPRRGRDRFMGYGK